MSTSLPAINFKIITLVTTTWASHGVLLTHSVVTYYTILETWQSALQMGKLRFTAFTNLSEVTRGHGEEAAPWRLKVHPFEFPHFSTAAPSWTYHSHYDFSVLPYTFFSHVLAQHKKHRASLAVPCLLPRPVSMQPSFMLLFFPPSISLPSITSSWHLPEAQ